jgi:hypothetical protein
MTFQDCITWARLRFEDYSVDRVQNNCGVIADNAADIADTVSNHFNSYAESSCAALVVASISSFGINYESTPRSYPPSQFCRYHCLFDNHLICN